MFTCSNCGTQNEVTDYDISPIHDRAVHLPECHVPWIRECICIELQMAYDRGVKDGGRDE